MVMVFSLSQGPVTLDQIALIQVTDTALDADLYHLSSDASYLDLHFGLGLRCSCLNSCGSAAHLNSSIAASVVAIAPGTGALPLLLPA